MAFCNQFRLLKELLLAHWPPGCSLNLPLDEDGLVPFHLTAYELVRRCTGQTSIPDVRSTHGSMAAHRVPANRRRVLTPLDSAPHRASSSGG